MTSLFKFMITKIIQTKKLIEMSQHMHHEGTSCQCTARSSPYSQNLDEMDFTRGIWSAAMNGEVEQVQKYLDKKSSPDVLDSSGYTALVPYIFGSTCLYPIP